MPANGQENRYVNLVHHRLSSNLRINEEIEFRVDLRNRLFIGDVSGMGINFGQVVSVDTGLVDLGFLWIDDSSVVAVTNIDRLMLRYQRGKSTLVVGRQRINWGINTIWNPMDLFNAYNFIDFDYEERPGSDAVRFTYSPDQFSALECAVKCNNGGRNFVGASMYKWNRSGTDMQAMAGLYEHDFVSGFGWATSFLDAGFKGESAWYLNLDNPNAGVFTGALSIDYAFPKKWYGMLSVLYVSDPVSPLTSGVYSMNKSITSKSLMPFKWSVYSGWIKSISPVCTFSISAVYSPEGNNTILIPVVSWNAAQNLDFDLTLQSFWLSVDRNFEYGSTTAFVRARWSY
jgi:hypothetical protein